MHMQKGADYNQNKGTQQKKELHKTGIEEMWSNGGVTATFAVNRWFLQQKSPDRVATF